jgi:hypothetical protein
MYAGEVDLAEVFEQWLDPQEVCDFSRLQIAIVHAAFTKSRRGFVDADTGSA